MYDIIIIGAGPAGLTSALYALRANKKVLIFESTCYGGQIINANLIENYPGIEKISGFEFATNLYNQVRNLGAEIKQEKVTKITREKKVYTTKGEYQAKAIIIATGARNRKLGIVNEDELVGKGISYCATCDGNFYKGKKVAVIGSGNTALEDTLYLSNIASKVYLINRKDIFKGEDKYLSDIMKKDNVEIIYNSSISEIIGDEKLEKIVLNDNKKIDVDGLFIAVGRIPDNEIFEGIVEMNNDGYILCDDNLKTNIDGIYVVGDARVKELRQLTTAVSDGSIAATEVIKKIS